jgi:HEPN domain-containing protein
VEQMSEIIHSTAKAYFLSYKCLIDKHIEVCNFYSDYFSAYFIPAITTAAFSCELALKSILHPQIGKTPRGHDLNKLFSKLNQQSRIDIMERTIQAYNVKSEVLRVPTQISEADFYNLLCSHKDTFTTVRYFYEGISNLDIDFVEAFMFCLNDAEDDYRAFVKYQSYKKQLNEKKA